MKNEYERNFIELLEQAKRYVKDELELDNFNGEWLVMDYREDLKGAFPIKTHGFNEPIITDEYAKNKGINITKCCNECGILYVG